MLGSAIIHVPGFVHPDWRRHGLGAAMLAYNERHLHAIARGHLTGAPKHLRVWATDSEYGALALFARAGYEPVRHYIMMTRPIHLPLSEAVLPEGLEVRPVRCWLRAYACSAKWVWRKPPWGSMSRTPVARYGCTRAWATGG